MSVPASEIAKILGGRRVLGRTVSNMRELDSIVREGMPKRALDRLLVFLAAPSDCTETRPRIG